MSNSTLYAEETPDWLSIHKLWMKDSNRNTKNGNGKPKPVVLRKDKGEILRFKSMKKAAEYLNYDPSNLSHKIKKYNSFQIHGICYEVIHVQAET